MNFDNVLYPELILLPKFIETFDKNFECDQKILKIIYKIYSRNGFSHLVKPSLLYTKTLNEKIDQLKKYNFTKIDLNTLKFVLKYELNITNEYEITYQTFLNLIERLSDNYIQFSEKKEIWKINDIKTIDDLIKLSLNYTNE